VLTIKNASVFDPEKGAFRENRTVTIDQGRIVAVGPAEENPSRNGAASIDGTGRFLIPGLIDAHVHLTHHLYEAGMTALDIFPNFLRYGVTSVRSTGDSVVAQILLKRIADEDGERSPRLFLASPLVGDAPPIHQDIGWPIRKPEEVRGFVDQMARWQEITTLKIYANCHPDVARELIREGHRQGFKVAGHLSSFSAQDAVAAGIDSIEHIQSVSDFLPKEGPDGRLFDLAAPSTDSLIEDLASAGTYVAPTLMIFRGYLLFFDQEEVVGHPDNAGIPSALDRLWKLWNVKIQKIYGKRPISLRREISARYSELTRMLYAGGVRLLVGTDTPLPQVPPGVSLLQEMEWMVGSGIPTVEVLRAATVNNAAIVDCADRLGKIKPGYLADMVLLEADPLVDIRNARKIGKVIKGGWVVDPADLANDAVGGSSLETVGA
jgi:hypothetical protein